MQKTKFYCDRCGIETTKLQRDQDIVRVWDKRKKIFIWKGLCKKCEKEIIAFVKPQTRNKKLLQKHSHTQGHCLVCKDTDNKKLLQKRKGKEALK